MTVKSSRAKKRTLVVPKSLLLHALSRASQETAPSRPPVLGGPKRYGTTPKGRVVVNRWYVTERDGRWFVWDFEEGQQGEENGYRSKENAIEYAERHRDMSSAYTQAPF